MRSITIKRSIKTTSTTIKSTAYRNKQIGIEVGTDQQYLLEVGPLYNKVIVTFINKGWGLKIQQRLSPLGEHRLNGLAEMTVK
jgi:hypothetical protein